MPVGPLAGMALRSGLRYAPYAINAARGAIAMARAARARRGQTVNRNYRGGSSSPAVTFQTDQATTYVRRRASRRFRRKAKRYYKFVKKVIAAGDTRNEKQRILFVTQVGWANSVAGSQDSTGEGLQLYGGGAGTNFRDMSQIFTAVGASNSSDQKVYMRAAHLECQIKNNSQDTLAYVELYYYRARKDTPASIGTINNYYTNGFDANNLATGSNMIGTTYGATPFHSGDFCEHFKIYKKRVLRIPAGQSVEINYKDSKNRLVDYQDFLDKTAVKGITSGIFAIYYGDSNSSGVPQIADLAISCTRTYMFTHPKYPDTGSTVLTS